ncbi:GCN5-related N-acetyltransferase [Sphingosinicellaceae bacterium]|nr:GCN5-related N-acetyltransferase [Sphingosinicellaceae bacterium]
MALVSREALRVAIDAAVTSLVAEAAPGWPIRHDHCFLRVAYDNACGAKWDTVVRPPAKRNLPVEALAEALRLLETMADAGTLRALNNCSLALRGHLRGK